MPIFLACMYLVHRGRKKAMDVCMALLLLKRKSKKRERLKAIAIQEVFLIENHIEMKVMSKCSKTLHVEMSNFQVLLSD